MITTIKKEKGDLEFKVWENGFLPKKIISVTTKSSNKDICKNFISDLLTADYQNIDMIEGLSVNKLVLNNQFDSINKENNEDGCNMIGFRDKNGNDIDIKKQPISKSDFNIIINNLKQVRKITNIDRSLFMIIKSDMEKYITGKVDINSAMFSICEKLNLFLSE